MICARTTFVSKEMCMPAYAKPTLHVALGQPNPQSQEAGLHASCNTKKSPLPPGPQKHLDRLHIDCLYIFHHALLLNRLAYNRTLCLPVENQDVTGFELNLNSNFSSSCKKGWIHRALIPTTYTSILLYIAELAGRCQISWIQF